MLPRTINKTSSFLKKLVGLDDIYTIAIRKRRDLSLFEGDLAPFTAIPYSKKYWYADPILVSDQSGTYLFAEAFERKKRIGRISVSTVSDAGEIGEPQLIISEPHHMSFPFVFKWNEKYYMIPETSENNSIKLYMPKSFPYDWQLVKSWQIGKKLVDSVLIECNGNELQFLSSEVDSKNLLRCRYVKYSLVGMDDLTSCELVLDHSYNDRQKFSYDDRNAGAIIESKSSQILPTQSSTTTEYGVSLVFRNKQKLSRNDSPEIMPEDIRITGMNNKLLGVHTYAQNDKFEVIDARYIKYCPESVIHRIGKKLRKK